MSTIKNDLALFNELAEVLMNEEQKNPVAERIETIKIVYVYNKKRFSFI